MNWTALWFAVALVSVFANAVQAAIATCLSRDAKDYQESRSNAWKESSAERAAHEAELARIHQEHRIRLQNIRIELDREV